MTANTALFILGGLVFLVAFSWFKAAALKLYSTSINKDAYDNKSEWINLFRVFLVDWLVCILGALFTGIIFVSLFNLFHCQGHQRLVALLAQAKQLLCSESLEVLL